MTSNFVSLNNINAAIKTATPLLLSVFTCVIQGPASAEIIKTDSGNEYLKREYDWAMFLDIQEVPHYLNYQSSSLRSILRVRTNYKPFPRGEGLVAPNGNSRVYEELWYHKGLPLGSERRFILDTPRQEIGVIVLRNIGPGPERAQVALNAALRLMLDLQFKHLRADVIAVPLERYDAIAGALEYYRFTKVSTQTEAAMNGKQLSILLQSYPSKRDERYFLQK